MPVKPVWHEDDEFWRACAPLFFSAEHWAAAGREAELALALAGATRCARVLDMGCGPGRHSLALARLGLRVTGVDRTAEFVEEARLRAAEEGLEAEFVLGDMRTFVRPLAFELALSLSTSFGYFEDPRDDARTLANIFESLVHGGAIVMEMLGLEVESRHLVPRERREIAGLVVEEERRITNDAWFEKKRRITGPSGQAAEFAVSHRLYSAESLHRLLAECGFRDVRLFGGLDGRPYDAQASRLVAVARRPGGG